MAWGHELSVVSGLDFRRLLVFSSPVFGSEEGEGEGLAQAHF